MIVKKSEKEKAKDNSPILGQRFSGVALSSCSGEARTWPQQTLPAT